MSLALARKWRPKTFTELVGQDHVVSALTNAIIQGRDAPRLACLPEREV
jgi:DNA polymerase-3 subunit gamma/tau